MKVLSLFNGISCGRIALERANINVEKYVSYEIDEYANKVAKSNYPNDEYNGDVIKADFTQYKGFGLIIGGSPCTYWSNARANRETTAQGIGFKLFNEYARAIEEVKPKYFLYENNKSISSEIKSEITKVLKVEPIMINSSLVSGQERKRLYWTNIPNVQQPKDKGILFKELVKTERNWFPLLPWCLKKWGDNVKVDTLRKLNSDKSFCITTGKTHSKNYYLNDDRTMMTKLDAEEVEMLQTLPKGYTKDISETRRFKAIGNGWTVDVVSHILSNIEKEE